MDSGLITILLPLALAIIMMGLGLELTPRDFSRVTRHPKAVFIALFCQLVILVGIAFLLCKLFALTPLLSVGLMLLAASPGGATANLFSYLFKGDLALNITLTAINPNIEVQTGLPQHKRQWEVELEHHLSSLETMTVIDKQQENYVEGFISALFHSSTIDLTKASVYRNRLKQIRLI